MPQYFFRCNCGWADSAFMTMDESKKRLQCKLCGKIAERDFIAEHMGTVHIPGNWPMESDALGVHPSQRQAAYEHSVRAGCPTQFTKDGCAILTSPGHRRKLAESLGMYDRNAGYSDPRRR